MNNTNPIRIYVACLAAYNNGILHGAWIDAVQDVDAIHSGIRDMLAASPIKNAEEYAIHDYEGFGGVHICEYHGIASLVAYAEFIDEHGKLGAELINYFNDFPDAREAMDNRYHGEFASIAEFAQQLTEETGNIPQHLESYIDYERMGRDLEMDDVLAIETGHEEVHVFWGH